MSRDTNRDKLNRDRTNREEPAHVVTDLVLYVAAWGFAGWLLLSSDFVTFRTWASFSVVAYGVAAATTCLVLLRPGHRRRLPTAAASVAILVACVAPLLYMAVERVDDPDYAQSEVVVIESGAQEILSGRDPYEARFDSHELDGRLPAIREHAPYLPGMFSFGIPAALTPDTWPLRWATDARIWFLVSALLVATPRATRLHTVSVRRVWQLVFVLPPGALALAAGGDDVPVVALGLAALLALDRERAGVALGLAVAAGALKLTAWPLLAAVIAVAWSRGRRAWAVTSALVVAASLTALLVFSRGARGDLLGYPFGVGAGVSPANDPTLGTVIRDLAALSAGEYLLVWGVSVLLVVVLALRIATRRRAGRPLTAAEAATLVGVTWCALLALAPAWRPGYLIYPATALTCGVVLSRARPTTAPEDVPRTLDAGT